MVTKEDRERALALASTNEEREGVNELLDASQAYITTTVEPSGVLRHRLTPIGLRAAMTANFG